MRQLLELTVVRFVLVGIVNTIFGYIIFAILIYLGLNSSLALALSTFISILFNFKTIGVLVFRDGKSSLIYKFLLAYSLVYILDVLGLKVTSNIGLSHYIGQAILAFPLALLSYALNKYFVFTNKVAPA